MNLDKQDVLAGLFDSWDRIDKLLAGLSDAQWKAQTALPGWNVQAVASHVIGTESFLQGLPVPDPDCDVAALAHVNNPIGVMNECWVRHLRDESPSAMLERFRAITADRRKALKEMTDQAWAEKGPTPVGVAPYGRFMRVRTFDCWMHAQDMREAAGVEAAEEDIAGPAGEHSLGEITASLGYIVGKRGGAPEGSRVAFELTGPLQRTLRVSVDGRAQVVDAFDGDPTTTIGLDAVLFTRLAGGRTTAAEHAAEIRLDGDTELGQQIVDNLNFVI